MRHGARRWLTRSIQRWCRGGGGRATELGAQRPNFLDQIVVKGFSRRRYPGALRFWNIVRRPERERLEADLGVAARQSRSHDDDQTALLRQQQRQRGNPVKLRHLDIK